MASRLNQLRGMAAEASKIATRYGIPHRREALWKEIDAAKNHLRQRPELKLEDAGIAAFFGVECFAWFVPKRS